MIEGGNLSVFVAVAQERSFSRAAEKLGTVQSVVSKRLQRLEDQLACRLVDRSSRSEIRLTRMGELLLPEAQATLQRLADFERVGRNLARGEAGPLRLGFVFSAAMNGFVPRILSGLRRDMPTLDVALSLMETPEQLQALTDGRIDAGLIRPRPSYPANCSWETACADCLVLGMAADHRLAEASVIESRDLAAERFVIPQFHEKVGLVDSIARLSRRAGFSMPDLLHTSDFVTAACFTAAGHGIMLAPQSLCRLKLDNLIFRDIADFREQAEIVLIYRHDAPAMAMGLIRNTLRKH